MGWELRKDGKFGGLLSAEDRQPPLLTIAIDSHFLTVSQRPSRF